jgi:hypothetical protein
MGGLIFNPIANLIYTNTAARSFIWLDDKGYRHQTISQECIITVTSHMICNVPLELLFCYDNPGIQLMNISLVNMIISPVAVGCSIVNSSPIDTINTEINFLRNQFSY